MRSFFYLLLLTSSVSLAQTPTVKLPEVIGPSPEAASFQKYGDYEVSTYTGVPDITIPLYTIKLKDLEVPITLTYNGSGIRVDEESSRVGLGWVLNAGGMISRMVKGLDDMWSYSLHPTAFDLIGFPEKSLVSTLSLPFGGYTYDISGLVGTTIDPTMPYITVDLEPDLFYCNFQGINTKFMIKKADTTAILEDPSTNLKVRFNIATYSAHDGSAAAAVGQNCTITVTGPDGTIYSFNQFETCESIGGPITVPNHITAWYLTQIKTIKNTIVNFNYTQSNTGYTYTLNHPSATKYPFGDGGTQVADGIASSLMPRRSYRNLLLTSITSPDCNVYLTYDSRLDLQGDQKLTSVKVMDPEGHQIKRTDLVQNYFTANSDPGNTFDVQSAAWGGPALDSNWIKKKLKLTEVREISTDGLTTLSTKLKYDEHLIPFKNSTSRDHWGFFNNAANGNSIIPEMHWSCPMVKEYAAAAVYQCSTPTENMPNNDVGDQNWYYHETPHRIYYNDPGANREVDTNYSRAFMLDTIEYPTGGYTCFEFEQNTYDKKKSFLFDKNAEYYDYAPTSSALGQITGITAIPAGFSQSISFNITANDTLPGEDGALFKFQLKATKGATVTTFVTTNTVVNLKNASGTILGTLTFNDFSNFTDNHDGTYSSNIIGTTLPIGTYTLQIIFGGNTVDRNCVIYSFNATLPSRIDKNIDGPLFKYAGGLRVRRISSFNPSNLLAHSTTYTYHYSADNNNNHIPEIYSTGKLMERPNYFGSYFKSSGGIASYLTIKSESDSRPIIGYDSVIVNNNDIRYSEAFQNTSYRPNVYKRYYNTPNNEMPPVGYSGFMQGGFHGTYNGDPDLIAYECFDVQPEGINNFTDNSNGKLIQRTDYISDGAIYRTIKKVKNVYNSNGIGVSGVVWADRMYASDNGVMYGCLTGLPPFYGITNFFYPAMSSVPPLLFTSTEIQYGASSADSVKNVTTYTYNSQNVIARISVLNSKGDSIISSYTYPIDYTASSGDIFEKLENANIITPIDQRTLRNTLATGGTFIQYDASSGPILPHLLYSLDLPAPQSVGLSNPSGTPPAQYTVKGTLNYDPVGSLLQATGHDGLNTAYVWDSCNAGPIAKAVNANSDDIAFTSFEYKADGNWDVYSANRDSTNVVTGRKAYSLASGVGKSGLTSGKKYVVTFWVLSGSGTFSITGGTAVLRTGRTLNNWQYNEETVTMTGTGLTLSGSATIDELRLYPVGSQMTSYTYSPQVGMTSADDPNGDITYYEYDNFQRLKNIKDRSGNIVKNYQYNYGHGKDQGSTLEMKTFAGTATLGYPVGVFNIHGKLIDTAANQAQYITVWMSDTADSHSGVLSAGVDRTHFSVKANAGRTAPTSVTGCRYYQYDVANVIYNGITKDNGCYVDFGDGYSMPITGDSLTPLPPRTTGYAQEYVPAYVYVHTYPDTTKKTITIFHNDQDESPGITWQNYDIYQDPSRISNVRGNFPQHMTILDLTYYSQASAMTIANIHNWNSINSVLSFTASSDSMAFSQDFMRNNVNLEDIEFNGWGKVSLLKSDWNTYFTKLGTLDLFQWNWDFEDINHLDSLGFFAIICAGDQPEVTSDTVDRIFNQIAAGAGQFISNGRVSFEGGNYQTNTPDSYDAVNLLLSKDWGLWFSEGHPSH